MTVYNNSRDPAGCRPPDLLRAQDGAPDTSITPYEFRLLRDYVHEYCGIYYDDSKAGVLASRLSFRMRLLGISSYTEYYNHLRFNPRSREEMDDLIPHLTNNETYFFRELNQVSYLISHIADRVRKGAAGKIRLLSCGCSSGEEAFTLAIMLAEAGAYAGRAEIEIVGIDIDRKVIEKASSGLYTSYSLRSTKKEWIEKYFSKEGDKYRLSQKIRERVVFRKGNLLERATFSGHRGADVILCRNVFIYFSDGAIRRIVESFHETLSDEGLLLLGHSESLSRITAIFHPRRQPNVIVYSKKES